MSFAEKYYSRYNVDSQIFPHNINPDLKAIVVIPCYDDDFIFETLDSIETANHQKNALEVIIIINSSELSNNNVVENNRKIYQKLETKTKDYNFTLLNHLVENVPKKLAGVGFARRIGMNEALSRFDKINKSDGLILSLDADTLVTKNYFESIFTFFAKNKRVGAAVFGFSHSTDNSKYSEKEIMACKLYEKYLKYFKEQLNSIGFPYYFHTIGSCFGVKAANYIKVGGMGCQQGGEDFYFLHKLAQTTFIGDIEDEIVIPSPRISDRVPFGTGPAVKKIIENGFLEVYNRNLFPILEIFFVNFSKFYHIPYINVNPNDIPTEIIDYQGLTSIQKIIDECRANSSSEATFTKRMFSKFDALWIVKFLNSFADNSNFLPEKWKMEQIRN